MVVCRVIMLSAGILLSDVPAFSQESVRTSVDSKGSFGLSAALSRFQTENFGVSTSRGFGGWIDVGPGKWTTNIDGFVGRNNWVVGVSALRRIEMPDHPERVHFLFGAGVVSSTVANDMTMAVAGGLGIDIPARRFLARVQYRVYCAGADGPFINQFQAGAGLTF
jgi:hypothetical protein